MKTVPIEALMLHRFSSPEENREHLCHVHFERLNPETMCAVATDGHRLARFEFVDRELPEAFRLSADACVEILKGRRAEGEGFAVDIVSHDKDETCAVLGKRNELVSAVALRVESKAYGKFPDWHMVEPPSRGPRPKPTKHNSSPDATPPAADRICFNASYVGDVATYLKKCGHENQGITFQMPLDDLSPIRITHEIATVGTLTYTLMPCRF